MITLYNAISEDGYIARVNSDEDFIPDEVWEESMNLYKNYDTVVKGRKTYEAIQKYSPEAIKLLEDLNIKKIIVTNNLDFKVKPSYIIAHSLKEAFSYGKNILVVSGSTLNDIVIKEGWADRVIYNVIPVKIGNGIKPFINEPTLELISEKNTKDGRKWMEYKVIK